MFTKLVRAALYVLNTLEWHLILFHSSMICCYGACSLDVILLCEGLIFYFILFFLIFSLKLLGETQLHLPYENSTVKIAKSFIGCGHLWKFTCLLKDFKMTTCPPVWQQRMGFTPLWVRPQERELRTTANRMGKKPLFWRGLMITQKLLQIDPLI